MSDYKSTYTAEEVLELADYFETLASDQIACKRWQTLKREKTECDIKAYAWNDAAAFIREQIKKNG